jgi:hypothetical protein
MRRQEEEKKFQYSSYDLGHIAKSLGNASKTRDGFLCRCPVPSHGKGRGDKDPSLSILIGNNGQLLVNCHASCDYKDVLKEIKNRGLLHYNITDKPKTQSKCGFKPVMSSEGNITDDVTTLQPKPPFYDQNHEDEDPSNKETALKLWDAASEIEGTQADIYLRKRGIDTTSLKGQLSYTLRFHPSLRHPYLHQQSPCLIAKVRG